MKEIIICEGFGSYCIMTDRSTVFGFLCDLPPGTVEDKMKHLNDTLDQDFTVGGSTPDHDDGIAYKLVFKS